MKTDARPPHSNNVRGRALLVVAIVSLVGAAALGGYALFGADEIPEATLQITPMAVETLPVTVPPRPDPTTPATAVPAAGATSAPLSPLAAQLGPRGSAIPAPPRERILPTSITIDGIELWGPVRPVGLEDDGEMEVPDETEVGWYDRGAAPGEEGATVLAAHVTWNNTVGPFFKLGDLEPGAEVNIRLADGSARMYEVVERAMYPKDGLPDWRIFRRTGPESLVLITCGGSFNPNINRYRDNIVVYAVPVGTEPAATEPADAADAPSASAPATVPGAAPVG